VPVHSEIGYLTIRWMSLDLQATASIVEATASTGLFGDSIEDKRLVGNLTPLSPGPFSRQSRRWIGSWMKAQGRPSSLK
jgi:hypothetical protein